MVTKTSCCMPKMTSGRTTKWANANSMTFQNYTIENKLTIGSGVGATSRFVQSALRNRAKTNTSCCMFKLNQLSYMRNVRSGPQLPTSIINVSLKSVSDTEHPNVSKVYYLTDEQGNAYWNSSILINGKTSTSLNIQRNTRVVFKLDNNVDPLYLSEEIDGNPDAQGEGNKYEQDIVYSSNYSSSENTEPKFFTLTVTNKTPNRLYYYDPLHEKRGGTIVVNPTINSLAD